MVSFFNFLDSCLQVATIYHISLLSYFSCLLRLFPVSQLLPLSSSSPHSPALLTMAFKDGELSVEESPVSPHRLTIAAGSTSQDQADMAGVGKKQRFTVRLRSSPHAPFIPDEAEKLWLYLYARLHHHHDVLVGGRLFVWGHLIPPHNPSIAVNE